MNSEDAVSPIKYNGLACAQAVERCPAQLLLFSNIVFKIFVRITETAISTMCHGCIRDAVLYRWDTYRLHE